MLTGIILGLLQGTLEWMPVSSQGVVALSYSLLMDQPISDAVGYALWLHGGTALSAAVAFRRDIAAISQDIISLPGRPSSLLIYLVVTTVLSALVALPVLVIFEDLSSSSGYIAMGIIGGLMVITGLIQLRRPISGNRGILDTSVTDAILTGVAQGLAVLPGLSRSGLTVVVLLVRRMDAQSAVKLSFLMSIPASVGASVYGFFNVETVYTRDGLLAGMVAFAVGLLTIRALIAIVGRVNIGVFVFGVGLLIVVGCCWALVAT